MMMIYFEFKFHSLILSFSQSFFCLTDFPIMQKFLSIVILNARPTALQHECHNELDPDGHAIDSSHVWCLSKG